MQNFGTTLKTHPFLNAANDPIFMGNRFSSLMMESPSLGQILPSSFEEVQERIDKALDILEGKVGELEDDYQEVNLGQALSTLPGFTEAELFTQFAMVIEALRSVLFRLDDAIRNYGTAEEQNRLDQLLFNLNNMPTPATAVPISPSHEESARTHLMNLTSDGEKAVRIVEGRISSAQAEASVPIGTDEDLVSVPGETVAETSTTENIVGLGLLGIIAAVVGISLFS